MRRLLTVAAVVLLACQLNFANEMKFGRLTNGSDSGAIPTAKFNAVRVTLECTAGMSPGNPQRMMFTVFQRKQIDGRAVEFRLAEYECVAPGSSAHTILIDAPPDTIFIRLNQISGAGGAGYYLVTGTELGSRKG